MDEMYVLQRYPHPFKQDVSLYYIGFKRGSSDRLAVMSVYQNSHDITFELCLGINRLTKDEEERIFSWFISQNENRLRHVTSPYHLSRI